MKIFIYVLILLSSGLVIYNLTQIDYNASFQNNSVALITVVAGLCAILLLAILLTSKKIQETLKKRS